MIATFAVFRLVIDDVVNDLDFTDGIVALEVAGIVLGIPKTKLNGTKYG